MNVTNILIIGAVVLVGIFFVLPMLGSSKSDNPNGSGSLGGGDMPTGNQGAGESKDATNIFYIPGTGSNDSVARDYTPNAARTSSAMTTTTVSSLAGAGKTLFGTGGLISQVSPSMMKVDTSQKGFTKAVTPKSSSGSRVNVVTGNGSGKSTTQNLTTTILGKKASEPTKSFNLKYIGAKK